MKIKWHFILYLGFFLMFLAGCNQIEDILTKVDQLLDEQLTTETSDQDEDSRLEQTNQVEGTMEDENSNDEMNHANEAKKANELVDNESESKNESDDSLSFKEKLKSQGYEIRDLPNGLPLDVPDDWVLVDDNSEDTTAERFEGIFCFDNPMNFEQIATQFGTDYDYVHHEHFDDNDGIIHQTSFYHDFGYEELYGYLMYYIDENDHKCARAFASFNFMDDIFGEDPATMLSEEEMLE